MSAILVMYVLSSAVYGLRAALARAPGLSRVPQHTVKPLFGVSGGRGIPRDLG
jgi:hypothetical protein